MKGNILSSVAENKNISIVYQEQSGMKVKADANLLSTVLRNLLSNAIKFSFEKTKIEISTRNDDSQKKLIVSIKDSGVGMSQEKLNKLFDISYNNVSFGTKGEKGTGLGLVLCKEFIEKMSGKLSVESEEGKGTTFTFDLLIY